MPSSNNTSVFASAEEVLNELLNDLSTQMKGSQFYTGHKAYLTSLIDAALNKNRDVVSVAKPIIEEAFEGKEPLSNKRLYISTAGAPLVGKSTILSWMLDEQLENGIAEDFAKVTELNNIKQQLPDSKHIVAADPDVYGIYKIARNKEHDLNESFYNLWREMSIVIDICVRIKALDKGFVVAHGTTATNQNYAATTAALKELGYQHHIIAISAPEDIREAFHKTRAHKSMYQCSPQDRSEKQIGFYANMCKKSGPQGASVYGRCIEQGAKLSWFGYDQNYNLVCILDNNTVKNRELLSDMLVKNDYRGSSIENLQSAGILPKSNYCGLFAVAALGVAVVAGLVVKAGQINQVDFGGIAKDGFS